MGNLLSESWSSTSLTQVAEKVNTMASSWRWGVVKDWLPASETMRCRSDTLPGTMRRPNRALEQSDLPPDLSPEQRRKLEALIRWADETAETLPPPDRSRLEGDRKTARLILRVMGADRTEDDLRALAEQLHVPLPAPWSWVKRERGVGYRKWTDDRLPRNTEERRHKRQKDFAVKAVLGWIGHPAVAREVETARPAIKALVAPLDLPDQGIVTFVTGEFLDCASVYPDGSEWPDPFAGAPADVIELAEQIQPTFVANLRQLAARIEAAGVPLDPNDPAVLLVLSQLTLVRVALDRPPAEIVADLNIWPPGSIDREAATVGQVAVHASRHGRTVRFQADLVAGAETVARRLGPAAIRAPYAGGGKRQKPRQELVQEARRAALAEVLAVHPDANAGRLRRTWDGPPSTPGRMLRERLGRLVDDPPPAETTLRRDLLEIG
jgi:hypothetical protein